MREFRAEAVSYRSSPHSTDRHKTCKVSVFFETHTKAVLGAYMSECMCRMPQTCHTG